MIEEVVGDNIKEVRSEIMTFYVAISAGNAEAIEAEIVT